MQKGQSLPEFLESYGTDPQCEDALFQARWPEGFQCPACGYQQSCRLRTRKVWQCIRCKHQASLTAGTLFDNTKLPLRIWHRAMYLLTQSKNGISAMDLKRQLGVSYNTAWRVKHKLMQAMRERDDSQRLQGTVELDDAYLGGEVSGGKRGRGAAGKTPFVAAAQVSEEGPQRLRPSPVRGLRLQEPEAWPRQLRARDPALRHRCPCQIKPLSQPIRHGIIRAKTAGFQRINPENNTRGIAFLTLRRRSAKMVEQLLALPRDQWRPVQLTNVGRRYRTPRILDQTVRLQDYPLPIRQIAIRDLGHDNSTLLLTNQLSASPCELIDRYARRMLIENTIADAVNFFHLDALSAAVPLRIDLDVQLTVMASALYRLLATRAGQRFRTAEPATLFRKFVDASASVDISDHQIVVTLGRRAHNPHLIEAGYSDSTTSIPWLHNRALKINFA